MIAPAFTVDVKLSIELLNYLLERTDEEMILTLEGNLVYFDGRFLRDVVWEEATLVDYLAAEETAVSRVVVPLYRDNVLHLRMNVLPRAGIRSHIRRVKLERRDMELFESFDGLATGTLCYDWLTPDFLQQLQEAGVIR